MPEDVDATNGYRDLTQSYRILTPLIHRFMTLVSASARWCRILCIPSRLGRFQTSILQEYTKPETGKPDCFCPCLFPSYQSHTKSLQNLHNKHHIVMSEINLVRLGTTAYMSGLLLVIFHLGRGEWKHDTGLDVPLIPRERGR